MGAFGRDWFRARRTKIVKLQQSVLVWTLRGKDSFSKLFHRTICPLRFFVRSGDHRYQLQRLFFPRESGVGKVPKSKARIASDGMVECHQPQTVRHIIVSSSFIWRPEASEKRRARGTYGKLFELRTNFKPQLFSHDLALTRCGCEYSAVGFLELLRAESLYARLCGPRHEHRRELSQVPFAAEDSAN